MTNDPTREEVLASIVASSEQLNAEDLIATGPITVTVKGVRRGSKEQPIQIDFFERDRPFRPCKTVRRTLIALWSDDPAAWIGKKMTIYTDPDVVYAGVRVGGLRISHASGIAEPRTLLLTKTRGKRSEVTIYPLETLSPEDAKYIGEVKRDIETAQSVETLKAIGFLLKQKPKAIQDALRPAFAERQSQLKGEAE